MKKVHSKYRVLGGFSLLLILSALASYISYQVVMTTLYNKENSFEDTGLMILLSGIILVNFLFILLFISQCRLIIADLNGIKFINPILPFLRKSYAWSDFDYYVIVDEHSRYNTHEAVWFIKDGKIKKRFSSFYYANYHAIKAQIKTKSRGKRELNPFIQFFALLRLKTIEE